ncbi:threonine aldolase family protein [Bradyrhizobium commune]|uniref:Aminotransferase class I/II-fold pyridoxal phosphate-dependent enzyme n=1 Tax=Bradyrhizobium commune TaxID=83627 RepID=A0A7S9H1Q0_9BRAD|nr:GntG family PLP-dependent aldolase [Bradyrhizobium commune]QPF94230.1 aminotransferase class I/II-fold pyridoxal phosphate-dependent enzyme [Bradyrhizobium commune]
MAHQHETNPAGAELPPVDLRSDTVTRPTEAMYSRMASAPIGDDGLDGDPTVQELEAVAAAALGKDAGLFVPSCTMANLLATLAQSQRSEQIVLESNAHMYTSERGAATFTGQFYLAVAGIAGAMDLNLLENALQSDGHKLKTALVAMETSHNNASGAVLPLDHMQAVHAMASVRGVPVHLDGARLFNAAIALEVAPAQIARHCDTVSLCLSKGLSAPAGAVLAGPRAVIDSSRRLRRMLGGTQRQIGILAAAGLEAVQVMGARLVEDHRRARALSEALNRMHPKVSATIPQTNIVQVDVSLSGRDSAAWSEALERVGLRARPWGRHRLRCVTHRHIDDADIDRAVMAFRAVASGLA